MGLRPELVWMAKQAVQEELDRVWDFADDVPKPSVDEVIDEALGSAVRDIKERADDLAECNHVDDCSAEAIVLRSLAELLMQEVT